MPTTDTTTREQHFADHIQQLRQKHPTIGDSYWAAVAEKQRLQWQIDDLRDGAAGLVGKYGYHAEQDPDNKRLADFVAELDALVSPAAADGGEGR